MVLCDVNKSKIGNLTEYSRRSKNVVRLNLRTYSCDLCGEVLNTYQLLYWHMRYHRIKNQLNCNQCSKIFESKEKIAYHMKKVHYGKIFSCDSCGFKTRYKRSLSTHMHLHVKNVKHLRILKSCKLCRKLVVDLKLHKQKHCRFGNKTMAPCRVCGKILSKRYIRFHIRNVCEKTTKCKQCEAVLNFQQMHM